MITNWLSTDIVINILFGALILTALCSGLINKARDTNRRLTAALPGICVSLGVLGTFTGIFIGLMNFNEQELSKSIPLLLGGMKTAFLTSLLGMGSSIFLNWRYACCEDLHKYSDNPMESLQRIEEAIVSCFKSDEEYSLVSQVKLIRQELIDSRRETQKAFNDFAEQFSKMASESLVEELQKVVDKFNATLNDLVRESFKELTESTIRLNEWQNEYKQTIKDNQESLVETVDHIQQLHSVFNETLTRMSELDEHLKSIDTSLTEISASSTELDEHSKAISAQNSLLEASILSIKEIGTEAKTVIPEITSALNAITSDVSDMQKETKDFVKETTTALQKNIENITEELANNATSLQEKSSSFVEKTTSELSNNYTELSEQTREHIKTIEQSLEEELTNSLNSLAGALASLSEKFVSDYTPLTEKLREVISIAEQVNVRAAS